ncbi:putative cupredoxin-like copper-binding protein [Janthinobacterium sp. CG_23.3]|uniref:hypothetical protein n=1 Tax=unclassified Janthinobacterium TaxID=2610881 RepID=UPI00034927A1|nr:MULTISPECIES: hypothetical protein [unclassified Janthinobacterium]MEC5163969.1 putative cupredoxin-like copper-binding protein [Janthinobacterium sp. CG_S6]
MSQAAVVTVARSALLLVALLPALSGCVVVAVASTVVGVGVSVASTAVDATVAVGKGAVKVGGAVLGSGDE